MKANARGRTREEVRADLEQALRDIDEWYPPEALDDMARAMAEPWWPLRHPVEFIRWLGSRRSEAASNEEDEDGADAFDQDPVFKLLAPYENEMPMRVNLVGMRRTFDGFAYQVGIYPWSEELAAEVRTLCAGFKVTVIEHRPAEYPPHGPGGRHPR